MYLRYYQILHSSNHPTPAWDLALLNFIKIQETQKKRQQYKYKYFQVHNRYGCDQKSCYYNL